MAVSRVRTAREKGRIVIEVSLAQIMEIADRLYPFEQAESWDNCGIQIGDPGRIVTAIAFSLDATPQTVAFASENRCELLITHHPVLIEPVRSVRFETLAGRTLVAAARCGVDIASLHTNFDAARGGLNDWIAARLGLEDVFVPNPAACARMGNLAEAMALKALARRVAESFGTSPPRIISTDDRLVKRVFCASGSGMGYLDTALRHSADVMVTGDARYHSAREALELGMPVIDAGHFGFEKNSSGCNSTSRASLAKGRQTHIPIPLAAKEVHSFERATFTPSRPSRD